MDTRQMLSERAAEFIERYYQNDLSLFWKYMRDDAIWIGPAEWHLIEGKDNIRAVYAKDRQHGLRFALRDMESHSRQSGRGTVITILKYEVQTFYPDGAILQHRQWFTLVWIRDRKEKGSDGQTEWKYSLVHTVNADVSAEQDKDRIYPVHLSKVMQGRMAQMIKLRTGRVAKVALEDVSRVTYYVSRYEILWVEGKHTHSLVHCETRTVEVNCSLQETAELLGAQFYRVHRSYLVNVQRIDHVERGVVVLDTGEELTIPARNCSAVKAELKQLLQGGEGIESVPFGGSDPLPIVAK